ncbi:MAG: urease accessory protein UreD, partial [Flavisolibacter sp.]
MISTLHIQTAARNGKTFLKNSYVSPPFKIADITESRACNDLRLVVMSSSPGILDGDQYQLSVELSEYSSLSLETQSYQRLF